MSAARRRTVGRVGPFVLLALGIVALGLVAGDRSGDGEPLDPRSTDPLGARGLVLLLEQFGAQVDLSGELPPGGGTAVVLVDRLGSESRKNVEDWVADGGTLVVADPTSSFAPPPFEQEVGFFDDTSTGTSTLLPQCRLPRLSKVSRIDVPGALPLETAEDAVGCFPVGTPAKDDPEGQPGSYLVARPSGAGVIVALGGGSPFLNRQLAKDDNAVLAVSLMAPVPGATVAVLDRSAPGSGREGLTDLIPEAVKAALWQLLVALALLALWRARRLGRPVLEPQPVEISGSELVVAVGNLLQQAKRRDQAAAMLRAQLRRTLSERLGLPANSPAHVLAAAVAARTGIPAQDVVNALEPSPPPADSDLVALAQSVESLRNEVTHVR